MRLFALIAAALPVQAAALELFPRGSWSMTQPASIAWDAEMCGLWVAQERAELVLVSPTGEEIRRIDSGFARARAVTMDGDTVIVGSGTGAFHRMDREGNLSGPVFGIVDGMFDIEGVHRDPDGSMLVVGDDPALIVLVAPDGSERWRIRGETLDPPLYEPQGVARDPISGNILIVDDNEGLNALFEFTPDGTILSVTSLSPFGRDAEAVAVQPHTGTLYIGFDTGQRIAVFDWLPTRISLPEPLETGPPCPTS